MGKKIREGEWERRLEKERGRRVGKSSVRGRAQMCRRVTHNSNENIL